VNALRAGLSVLAVVFAAASLGLVLLSAKRTLALRRWQAFRRAQGQVVASSFDAQGVLRVTFEVDGRQSQALDVGDEPQREDQRDAVLTRLVAGSVQPVWVDATGVTPPVLVTGLVQAPRVALIVGLIFIVPTGVIAGLVWYLGQPDTLFTRLFGGS
jgi:hypothetical protein